MVWLQQWLDKQCIEVVQSASGDPLHRAQELGKAEGLSIAASLIAHFHNYLRREELLDLPEGTIPAKRVVQ